MMTQVRTRALTLTAVVVLALVGAREQLQGRLHEVEGERGSQTLEWAIIAAVVVGIAAVVAVKIVAAVTTHAAQIK